jgi:cyclophilin family peptidyl-prolyl cis-trans isomerase
MRFNQLLLSVVVALAGCGPTKAPGPPPPNRWSEERLLPVLDAQEHRNSAALCALLKDTSATVRSAAALAFASVQDSSSTACLLQALGDPIAEVRVNAVFALGFIANDSIVDRMAERSDRERDSTVQRAYLSAMFLNLQRRGKFKDVEPAVYYLERNTGQERMRAADAIRRLSPALLMKDSALVLRAVSLEKDAAVKAVLLRALMQFPGKGRDSLLLDAGGRTRPLSMRVSAISALGFKPDARVRDSLLAWVADPVPVVRTAAIDALNNGGVFSAGEGPWSIAQDERWPDPISRYRIQGLMAGNREGREKAIIALRADSATGPYAEAERVKARGMVDEGYDDRQLEELLFSRAHPAIRQAAFSVLADRNQRLMMMPRAISYDMQVTEAAPFWLRVFGSGDPGLICAAAEKLEGGRARELRVLFPANVEQQAREALHPLRDLEAVQLLDGLAAARDEGPKPVHNSPAFNHPIDPAKLRTLPQGQRYRIVTNKGEIIIATDVDECPGSSLAFDSLVAAGYYNGKAFHRMVPNFVVQGGCPRGDGYGGMPWTLRTEIGRKLFTAGSVGLASAGRDTESCQFFITHSATPHLDGRYTRFGEVVNGMDVVWQLQVGDVMERVERID